MKEFEARKLLLSLYRALDNESATFEDGTQEEHQAAALELTRAENAVRNAMTGVTK